MKTPKKISITLGMIVSILAVYYLITTIKHTKKIQILTEAINQSINNTSANMQPCGIIAVGFKDKIIYSKSFGFTDKDNLLAPNLNTQYPVASITKQFTAVALIKALLDYHLQDSPQKDLAFLRHKIQGDLNRPLIDYLSEKHSVWQGSVPKWAKTITVHQLLVHTSGLVNYYNLPAFKKLTTKPPYNVMDLIKIIKEQPLAFTPGSKFAYSNAGYLFLGLIIERISGKKLDDYMNEQFFIPLNMQNTFLAVKDAVTELKKSDQRALNLSHGYEFDVLAFNFTPLEANYDHMEFIGAAGGLISTPIDLLKWNNALYTGKIIPQTLVELLVIPYVPNEQMDKFFGYGLVVKQDSFGKTYGHNGSFAGFATDLTYFSSAKISVISLSNITPNWDKALPEIKEIQELLPQNLSANLKWQKTQQSLEERHPQIARNIKKLNFMLIDQELIATLEKTLAKISKH